MTLPDSQPLAAPGGQPTGLVAAYRSLFDCRLPVLEPWLAQLPEQLKAVFGSGRYGELAQWQALLAQLPKLRPSAVVLDQPVVRIGLAADCPAAIQPVLEDQLRQLHPWRKGPFELYGIIIDSEWRSDFKWQRLAAAIQPLAGRLVLDVGAGNGYHCWRMLGAGARRVIGIDPGMRYVMQFLAVKQLTGDPPVDLLPLALEALPPGLAAFDTVFSMGVLYHRRSPFDHLYALKDCLRPGGELVLETLIVEGGRQTVLVPEGRYAMMPNVWFLPAVASLESWLKRVGFHKIRCIDVSRTTAAEQRPTDWMRFQSLPDFLDPGDPERTVEGWPAPRRAIFLAEKP